MVLSKNNLINLSKNMVVKYCNDNYFKGFKKITNDDVEITRCSRNWNIRIIKLAVKDGKKIRKFRVKYNYYTKEITSYEYKTIGRIKKDDINEFKQ